MKQKIAIITDSCCDISIDTAQQEGIEIIPMNINYEDKEYKDLYEISANEIYDHMNIEVPKTSIPSYGEIGEFLDRLKEEGAEHFIIINISSGLSGIHEACKQVLKEKGYSGVAIDTKGIGIYSGVFALYAARLRSQGKSYEEIVALIEKNLGNVHGYYTIKTLNYLMKGGRIGLVSGVLAGILNIKPIISCNEDGIYYVVDKVRGAKRTVERLADLLRKDIADRSYWMFFSEGRNPEGLNQLIDDLKTEMKGAVRTGKNQITATLGIHTGPGLIGGIVFSPEE